MPLLVFGFESDLCLKPPRTFNSSIYIYHNIQYIIHARERAIKKYDSFVNSYSNIVIVMGVIVIVI